MWKKTLLITGWLGYIWSHAVVAFEEAWYQTVIVDNLSNTSLKQLDGIEKILGYRPDFFEVDISLPPPDKKSGLLSVATASLGEEILEEIFQKYWFDGVIHFAGLKAVGESCEKPLLYFDNNVIGSLRLFKCMEKYGVKKILFSSSATVYKSSPLPIKIGTPLGRNPFLLQRGGQRWLCETDPVGDCSNPYGTTKFLLEQILKDLAKFSRFQVMNLRYFNPIGAHPSGYIGEDPQWIPNNLLPYIMKVATGELEKLSIFGDDYDTRDGTGVRDYIDVNDLIDGHIKAFQTLGNSEKWIVNNENVKKSDEGKNTWWTFDIYNLWVGRGVSVLEMVAVARKVTGKEIPYEIVGRREWDVAEVYCNPSKAEEELWWKAKVRLEESVRRSWGFYREW